MSSIYLIDYYSNNIDSPIHKISPISKLLFFLLILLSILFSNRVQHLLILIAIIVSLILIAKLPLLKILKWSLYLAFFASIFAISQIGYGILPILTFLKAESAALLALFIVCTTPYPKIFSMVNKISTTLASTMFLSYRFFFLLIDEVEMKLKCMKVRGGYSGGIIKKIKNIGSLIGYLLVSSIEKSERIYNALKVRGFRGRIYSLSESKIGIRDSPLIAVGAIAWLVLLL